MVRKRQITSYLLSIGHGEEETDYELPVNFGRGEEEKDYNLPGISLLW